LSDDEEAASTLDFSSIERNIYNEILNSSLSDLGEDIDSEAEESLS
jgi:hypothetical protein